MGDLKGTPIFFARLRLQKGACSGRGGIDFIGLGNFLQVLSDFMN